VEPEDNAGGRELADLRRQFPVLEQVAYLNAGTNGPLPRSGADAALAQLRLELERGRSGTPHWLELAELAAGLRGRIASLLGCDSEEVALTRSTTDGVNTVLSALDLRRGDEVLTSDEEHAGLLAPLAAARQRRGITIRTVPFAEIAGAVRAETRLVACSHVSWISGQVVAAGDLAQTGAPVLLDGAQGLGAVPAVVSELGCSFYAASGQKWLCGPDGSGYLYARADLAESLSPPWPGYESLADPQRPLALISQRGAQRFDMGIAAGPSMALATAALDLLASTGWASVFARGVALAARLAALLGQRGIEVAARGHSTLVAWDCSDPEAQVNRLADAGVAIRQLPGRDLVRASVGAWSSEDDLERLLATVV